MMGAHRLISQLPEKQPLGFSKMPKNAVFGHFFEKGVALFSGRKGTLFSVIATNYFHKNRFPG